MKYFNRLLLASFLLALIPGIAANSAAASTESPSRYCFVYYHALGGNAEVAKTFCNNEYLPHLKAEVVPYFPQAEGGSWFDIMGDPTVLHTSFRADVVRSYITDPKKHETTLLGKILDNLFTRADKELSCIHAQMAEHKIPADRLILSGESQGSLLAWAIAYRQSVLHKTAAFALVTSSAPPVWLSDDATLLPKFAILGYNPDDPIFPMDKCGPLLKKVQDLYASTPGRLHVVSPGGGHGTPVAFHAKVKELLPSLPR